MRILVTGGAGFIGTHLTRRLIAEGHQVYVIDNEFNGDPSLLPKQAIYTRGDIVQESALEALFARGLDAVCHIAAQVSIVRSFSDPAVDLRNNVEGTLNVIKMCLKYKVQRLIYASSMTLYGQVDNVPTAETDPCLPDSYYGITKYAAERYVHSTAERPDLDFDFRVTSLRMYSVYGPGQAYDNPYQGVLGIFSGNILRNEPITIFGDGEQTRDFIFIDDIVEAWVRVLSTPESAGRIINIGSGRSLTINKLAESVVAAFGYPKGGYRVEHKPARPGEQRKVQADIALARKILRWEPKVPFEAGLAKTVDWARREFSAEAPAAVGGAAR
jgi:UDP-glucose 4-epimerase